MPDAPFTVAPDGDRFAVIYHGNLRYPVNRYATRAEADAEASRRNREARARLYQAGFAQDERGHTTHESER